VGADRTTIPVWDPLVRLFHWSLVASIAVAWFSAHPWEALHYWAGYAASALIAIRLIWGFVGTPYARFSHFVRGPRRVLAYLGAVVSGKEARFIGHNPAGGAMVVALLATVCATALTGWLMTTDAYWGDEGMEHLHDIISHLLLVLVILHLGGVILASLRHRENLVAAMLSGRKRASEPGDID